MSTDRWRLQYYLHRQWQHSRDIAGISGQLHPWELSLCQCKRTAGTSTSSIRYKENIEDIGEELILNLCRVRFNYIADPDKTLCYSA